MRSAIIVTDAADPELPIIYINPAFEKLTGYGPDDVLGRNCRFLQGTDTDQRARHTIREALAKKNAARGILRNYRKDGSLFYNELFIDPVRDADGAVTHFVGCQTEISEPEVAYVLRNATAGFELLTGREREVFQLVVNGYTNKSIGRELDISPRTAEKHRIAVLKKFDVPELTLLVRCAIALGVPFTPPVDGGDFQQD